MSNIYTDQEVLQNALRAFWDEVVGSYPAVADRASDIEPVAADTFRKAAGHALEAWLNRNTRDTSRTYFREHPDIEFPAELIAAGFTDQSWHNDSCGKCALYLAGEDHEYDLVNVWVAEAMPERREWAGQNRFMIEIYLTEDDWGTGEGLVAETDDMAEVLRIAAEAKSAFAIGGHVGLCAYRKPVTPRVLGETEVGA